MANYTISGETLTSIANAIREKKKTTDLLTPGQMADEIRGIESSLPSSAEVTFGYVKKTETVTEQAPEGKCWYNGVLLPEIPTDVLASYPYAWIRDNGTTGEYDLVLSPNIWYYTSDLMNKSVSGTYPYYSIPKATYLEYAEWEYNSDSGKNFGLDTERKVLWSAFDIPNGSATATEIYFKGSEPLTELTETITQHVPVERESNYSITSEILNNIAKRTQETAGTAKLMTPGDIIYWLGRVLFISQGYAESIFTTPFGNFFGSAVGVIPVYQSATAESTFVPYTSGFTSSAVGELS